MRSLILNPMHNTASFISDSHGVHSSDCWLVVLLIYELMFGAVVLHYRMRSPHNSLGIRRHRHTSAVSRAMIYFYNHSRAHFSPVSAVNPQATFPWDREHDLAITIPMLLFCFSIAVSVINAWERSGVFLDDLHRCIKEINLLPLRFIVRSTTAKCESAASDPHQ